MKKPGLTAFILCLLALLSACTGNNPIIRGHLTDRENYDSYSGVIRDIFYYDEENRKVSILSSNEIPECNVFLELTFEDYDTVKKFLGADPNPEWSLSKYQYVFEITDENNQILVDNGFYSVVTSNSSIDISASSYIYMDANYFYIAAITYDDTDYLCFADGFGNIVEYINDHKGLL